MPRPAPRLRSYAPAGSDAVRIEAGGPQRLGAVLEGAPAQYPPRTQLEDPGHRVDARLRAVLLPGPAAPDQRHRGPAARGLVLIELVELDRLLHPAGRARRPQPRRVAPLAHAPHRVQLHVGIEHRHEGVEVALVEG